MQKLNSDAYSCYLLAFLLTLASLFTNIATANEAAYPKILTTKETQAHFLQFNNFDTDQERREFSFSIDGNEIQRVCPDCKYEHDVGLVTYKPLNNQICIEFEIVTFPDSGCFTLVQTGELRYEMRKLRDGAIFRYQVTTKAQPADEVLAPGWIPPSVMGRTILVDLSNIKPGATELQSAIDAALGRRGWAKEKYSSEKTTFARLKKVPKTYKVKIEYREPWLAIGFIKGYEHRRDNWLHNIKKDLLHSLAVR